MRFWGTQIRCLMTGGNVKVAVLGVYDTAGFKGKENEGFW